MNINLIFDQADGALPAGFKNAVNAVAQFFNNTFSDPITLNINVGFGEVNGHALSSGAIGQSSFSLIGTTYAQIKSLLSSDATTSDDSSALNSLPATDPVGGSYFVSRAEAKALGLIGTSSQADGSVGFSSTANFDYDNSNGVSPGALDFFGVVAHEISEVMGRVFGDGNSLPLDLLHFSSPGSRTFSGTTPGYFSIDNGATNLANFNTDPSGDFSDWANNAGADAFRAFAPSGTVLQITAADLIALDVIGYNRVSGLNVINGDAGNNTLIGTSANDQINGLGGNDLLQGGLGNDTLDGGTGEDVASYADATSGVTVSLALAGAQAVGGGLGSDTLTNIEDLQGSPFNDTLTGDNNNNVLIGGAGADALNGGSGIDTASYANATSGVYARLDNGVGYSGDAAGDTFNSIENLTGGSGDDVFIGNSLANVLIGGGGNDYFEPQAGADQIDGGTGIDTVSYAGSSAAIYARLDTGLGYTGDAAGDTFANVENLTGGNGDDVLIGNSVGNVLVGGAGNDYFEPQAGADQIDGGSGIDTVSYAGSSAAIYARLDTGAGYTGDAAGDTFANIENLTGGSGNDTLVGNSGANVLNGGGGNDYFEPGAGADAIDGGSGTDTVSYAGSTSGVYARLDNHVGYTGDAAGDTYANIENLQGGFGNDILVGDSGNNILTGGAGADQIEGGGGNDTVSYANELSGVYARIDNHVGYTGDAAGDTFLGISNLTGGSGNDIFVGNDNANVLTGGAGNDQLESAGGNDTIIGGTGNDLLVGGAGDDLFVFNSGDGTDTISDFTAGGTTDEVQLHGFSDAANFAALMALGTDHGTFTEFDFASGDHLILTNVALASLTSSDFIFT